MRSIKSLALGAGFAFVTLALFVQGVLPAVVPEALTTRVTRAVRTDTGEVKWVRYEASDYAPLERLGRAVYIREGCWYCHSQYVRPVAGEELRWGPVSEAGEYAYDLPHLFSTRRVGPDLTRVGLKYGDDWHYAHHWDPRMTVPDSIMPRFRWLFERVRVGVRAGAHGLVLEASPALTRYFTMAEGKRVLLFPREDGLTFVPPRPDGDLPIDGKPVLDLTPFKGRPPALSAVTLVIPSREMVGLVRYLQKLGTNRGAWREVFEPQSVAVSMMTIPDTQDLRVRGKEAYAEHCAGCHGRAGDGNGPAATFLQPRPRDLTAGVFKFRSTPSGSLPTDGDLFRTITRGVRWTSMPTWHEIPDKERLALVVYVKTLSRRWKDEMPEPPVSLPTPPGATPELLARGKALYHQGKCWECHGEGGKGDGPSAAQLRDDFDIPILPTDFTRGQLKGGSHVTDIYRALTAGLDGTPMPSYADAMTDAERWAVAYYVLSFSAWSDPLTGGKLRLSPETRARLNAPDVRADHPRAALEPAHARDEVAGAPGKKRRVYYPGVSE
ncbi:MAG: cytochrome c [Candidatus Rokubacteria bacterium]|nr:cytochrome c [Candidatus Rokubacteria bacterium]